MSGESKDEIEILNWFISDIIDEYFSLMIRNSTKMSGWINSQSLKRLKRINEWKRTRNLISVRTMISECTGIVVNNSDKTILISCNQIFLRRS